MDSEFLFEEFKGKRDRFVANINRVDTWFYIGNGAKRVDPATAELAKNTSSTWGKPGIGCGHQSIPRSCK